MEQITYNTPSGKTVTVTHITQRENLADHNVINNVDEIEIMVDGNIMSLGGAVVTHPTAGYVIEYAHKSYIYIAPEALESVKRLYAGHRERVRNRLQASLVADRQYQAHNVSINDGMTLNGQSY